jgi:UDP:flavonoid glycosyltransferase YjiC (YdhE family)
MTALLVSPDYLSHYLPMSAVGAALRDAGHEVVFATGTGLRERVLADEFEHVELRLGAGSNASAETDGGDPALTDFVAATRRGMAATLELQARRRADDLLWEPELVAARLEEIVDDVGPEFVLSDQLAFGASLALRALDVHYTSFLPGHPCQLPQVGMPFGFPGRLPPGFGADDLAGLYALCAWAARVFTRRFNRTLLELAPAAGPVKDAFAEGGTAGTIVNYPAGLAGRRPWMTLVGPCVRGEPGDPELDALRRGGVPPRAYVALGSFLSARSDVLRRIADGLRAAGLEAVIASGVTAPVELGALPESWIVRPHLPQVAALRVCDVVVSHGGNNTVMEALNAGLPVVALPFSTDQFAVAADIHEGGLGAALDPNRATADDLAGAVRAALAPGCRSRAAGLGRALRRDPGARRAARLVIRQARRPPARAGAGCFENR